MKCIVVNGDDLGASPGVNRGIAEVHRRGPLTSASLMVNMPASQEGARLARDLPGLSVGLHVNLTDASGRALVDLKTGERCRAVLHDQLRSFRELMGRPPTHLDSHHNLHRNRRLLPYFLEAADRYGLPLREHSPVRYFSGFYGQWAGETHLEQISVQGLIGLVESEISAGVTELSCHPGYCDPQLRSSYRMEREVELRTLCEPAVRAFFSARRIRLVNFGEAMDLLARDLPAGEAEEGAT
jgi:chitin disaccharide deacetylase